ncbi:MAG: hypothetical protein WCP45_11890 [Verrucomicrobiota bacterium]
MNPIAAFIAALVALKTELYTRFNASLAKLPPMEQIEGGTAVLSVIREVDWAKERIERVSVDLENTLTAACQLVNGFERKANEAVEVSASRLLDAMTAQAGVVAIQSAIAAKTHLPIDDHQAALSAAIEAATQQGAADAEAGFNARLADLQTITERRAAAIEKVGAVAASALKDVDLLAENHADILASIEGRITQLKEVGITQEARPKAFAGLLACAADEPGTAEFNARLEMIKEAVPTVAVVPLAAAATPKPSSPVGTLPAAAESKKTVI